MILLNEIKLNNFLSHENTTISFEENEKLLIDGRSGSGKSSITEAILWCLYGKGRSDNRSLVRRGTKVASVSLRIEVDGKSYVISRGVSSTGKNTLTATENTGPKKQFLPIQRVGIKDIQDWIENDLLKASYELFTNSVAYPQENENSFVKASASRRKDLLLEIVRASNFDELYIKARDAITGIESDIAVIISQMAGHEKAIRDNEVLAGKLAETEKDISETEKEIELKTKEKTKLEDKRQEAFYLNKKLDDKKAYEIRLSEGLHRLGEQIMRDADKVEEFDKFNVEEAQKKNHEFDQLSIEAIQIGNQLVKNVELQNKINAHMANKPYVLDYTNEIKRLNQQLIPLIKDSGKCPAGDDCPFTVPIRGQITFLEEQIRAKEEASEGGQKLLAKWTEEYNTFEQPTDASVLYARLEEIKKKQEELQVYRDMIKHFEIIKGEIESLRIKLIKDRGQIVNDTLEWNNVQNEVKEIEEKLSKFDSVANEVTVNNLGQILTILKDNHSEAIKWHTLALQAQKTLVDAQDAYSKANKDKDILKTQYEDLLLLKEGLSPRGIKAVVIDYLVPQLEERINEVLSQMSDFRIRLDTQKATVDEEGVKEGLFITVLNDQGEELPFESYSGGEKVKITISISEALASLMNQIGFRIMDENIISLDKESTEGFVEVLTKLQEKFPQLLVISHLDEVKDIFEKKILITKINGISKIS